MRGINTRLLTGITANEKDCLECNKRAWNKKVDFDYKSDRYCVADLIKKSYNSIGVYERNILGNIVGKRILHLQCYFGIDTISLSRMGAYCVGVDFSDVAICKAKSLSKLCNEKVEFYCSDVLRINELGLPLFDKVFCSFGALCWIPDIDLWAKNISSLLKSDGELNIVDFHPEIIMEAMPGVKNPQLFASQLRKNSIIQIERHGTYAMKSAPIESIEFNWYYTINQIIEAIENNNMKIDLLADHMDMPHCDFDSMTRKETGYVRSCNGHEVPCLFSLRAKHKFN